MPSLYSWSCKRSYKNGFVWSHEEENDVIHQCEGAEYVLKGSGLIEMTCGDDEEEEEEEDYFDEKRSNSKIETLFKENQVDMFMSLDARRVHSTWVEFGSAKCGLAEEEREEEEEEEEEEEKAVRGKCLPRKKFSSKQGKK
ncbi:hypothetical protein Syun_013654 [Stephania yunnanensis]|uniref:SOSEKI DIX-like domain-containing protein n=1 Tax=Stephania yunnanensis TaxID=152371 RepID=A0AAP0JI10_9MAGN